MTAWCMILLLCRGFEDMSLSGKPKLQQHDCEQLGAMKPWVRIVNDGLVGKLVCLERKEVGMDTMRNKAVPLLGGKHAYSRFQPPVAIEHLKSDMFGSILFRDSLITSLIKWIPRFWEDQSFSFTTVEIFLPCGFPVPYGF